MANQWRSTDQEWHSWWDAARQSTLTGFQSLAPTARHSRSTGRQQLNSPAVSRRRQLQTRLCQRIQMLSCRTPTAQSRMPSLRPTARLKMPLLSNPLPPLSHRRIRSKRSRTRAWALRTPALDLSHAPRLPVLTCGARSLFCASARRQAPTRNADRTGYELFPKPAVLVLPMSRPARRSSLQPVVASML